MTKALYLKSLEVGNFKNALNILEERRIQYPSDLRHPLALAMAYARRDDDFEGLKSVLKFFYQNGIPKNWTPYPKTPTKEHLKADEIILSSLWQQRYLSFSYNLESLRDFAQGGVLTWAAKFKSNPLRHQTVSYLKEQGIQPSWRTHWSSFHSALSVGDIELAQSFLETKPAHYQWDPIALIEASVSSFVYSFRYHQNPSINQKKWHQIQTFLEKVIGSTFFEENNEIILNYLVQRSHHGALHFWLQTPWANIFQTPEHWSYFWKHECSDNPDLASTWLDNPEFAQRALELNFCKIDFRDQQLPAYQFLLRDIGDSDEPLNTQKIDKTLQKLEQLGAKPWIGSAPYSAELLSDSEYFILKKKTPPESFLKRWPDFFENGGSHPGFAANNVEEVWQFKNQPEAWRQVNQKGEQLFAKWVYLAVHKNDKKLIDWIVRLWKSKKQKAPLEGASNGLSMLELATGSEKLFMEISQHQGYPNTPIALDRALYYRNDFAVYHIIQSYPQLAQQWSGEIIQLFQNQDETISCSWDILHFFKKPLKALVQAGWKPDLSQWLWLYLGQSQRKPSDPNIHIPSDPKLIQSHSYGHAYSLLAILPDTPPVGFSTEHLVALMQESIGEAREISPHENWANSRSYHPHPPISNLKEVLKLWNTLPTWAQTFLKESPNVFHAEQGWSQDEWLIVEGWWKLEALRESNPVHSSELSRKMRL